MAAGAAEEAGPQRRRRAKQHDHGRCDQPQVGPFGDAEDQGGQGRAHQGHAEVVGAARPSSGPGLGRGPAGPPARPAGPMGRLTKNAHRQPPAAMRAAPSDGPVATASAPTPPHSATTWDRRSPGKAPSSRPSEDGSMAAAPHALDAAGPPPGGRPTGPGRTAPSRRRRRPARRRTPAACRGGRRCGPPSPAGSRTRCCSR